MELFATTYLQSQYFWTTLAFLLLLGVISRFVVPAVNAALDARAAAVRNDLEAAARQHREAERVLAEYQAQLAEARKAAQQVVSEARDEAEAVSARRLAELESELERRAQEAKLAIEAARQQALRDVQAEVTALALQMTEKLLGQRLDDKTAAKVTDKSLN